MIRLLRDTDQFITRQLFHSIFRCDDPSYFTDLWKSRDSAKSIGEWSNGVFLGAAIVSRNKLEYIFVDTNHHGTGIGTRLLSKIIELCPNIYLNPIDDPNLIRWYERNGFHLSSQKGSHRCYVRTSHMLRNR